MHQGDDHTSRHPQLNEWARYQPYHGPCEVGVREGEYFYIEGMRYYDDCVPSKLLDVWCSWREWWLVNLFLI